MLRGALLMLSLLVAASPSLAAGGGESGSNVFFWQVANFALLVIVLVALLRKPFSAYFSDRRASVKGELDSAAELLDQAEKRHNEWQKKLIQLDTELENIRRESRERAQSEHDHILADARASAERIQRDALAAAEHELRRARANLRQETSDLAVELAEKILRERVLESDRDRLADEFISQLDRTPAGR